MSWQVFHAINTQQLTLYSCDCVSLRQCCLMRRIPAQILRCMYHLRLYHCPLQPLVSKPPLIDDHGASYFGNPPPELRLLIYRNLVSVPYIVVVLYRSFLTQHDCITLHSRLEPTSTHSAIMAVDHELYLEAIPVLCGENTFLFKPWPIYRSQEEALGRQLPLHMIGHIRNLAVSMHYIPDRDPSQRFSNMLRMLASFKPMLRRLDIRLCWHPISTLAMKSLTGRRSEKVLSLASLPVEEEKTRPLTANLAQFKITDCIEIEI